MFRSIVVLILLVVTSASFAQITGKGLLDGVYAFSIELRPSDDSFMEGAIQFNGDTSSNQLIATTRNDTLRCQEIDKFINPVASFLLIKKNGVYHGEYFDENSRSVLPVTLITTPSTNVATYYARRYNAQHPKADLQKLLDLPLSPTVSIGKYIDLKKKTLGSYSSSSSFGKVTTYAKSGIIQLDPALKNIQEEVPMESYFYKEKSFSIEAMIPAFSQLFVDSLQSALVHWKEKLEHGSIPISNRRFPTRFYAICDLDFWTENYISGSFEYVSPTGNGEGFTFIFDRRDDKFISFEKLIRSGQLDQQSSIDEAHLGMSFDTYGIIYKSKFNAVTGRDVKRVLWKDLNIRLKRKLNDSIR